MIVLQKNNIDEVMKLINEFARVNMIYRSRVEWEPGVYSQIDTNLISSNLCEKKEYGLSLNFQNDNRSFWDFGSVFELNEQYKFFTVKNNSWSAKMLDKYPNPTEYYFGYYNPYDMINEELNHTISNLAKYTISQKEIFFLDGGQDLRHWKPAGDYFFFVQTGQPTWWSYNLVELREVQKKLGGAIFDTNYKVI